MTPPQDSVSDVERLRAAWETIKREFGQYMEDGWNGQYPEVTDMDAAVAALVVPINKIGEDAKEGVLRRAREIAARFYDERGWLNETHRDTANSIRCGSLDDHDSVKVVAFALSVDKDAK